MKNVEKKPDPEFMVGDYEIIELNVKEGMRLIDLAYTGDDSFKNELLMSCVRLNGKPIDNTSFKKFAPVMRDVIDKAMEVNGFKVEQEDAENGKVA